ncbi:MAG: gluconolaconase [Cellvibrionaceae bacterium]|nr:gluconolaconase [Cellvibrionaceae bacterium]|tara:strand:- start:9676 stop:10572 length:897 start_codon:yes stop_codon:yes gene_type:complete
MTAKLIAEFEVHNELGEGIQWRVSDQSIWWTDILGCYLYRCQWPEQTLQRFKMPEPLCSFAFSNRDNVMVAAFASGLARMDLATFELDWLAKIDTHDDQTRLNDGRADRFGRFWVGSMVKQMEQTTEPLGELLRVTQGQVSAPLAADIWISNGLCWSPANDYLYFADSPRQSIYRYDFEGDSGIISNRTLFAKTPTGAYPDGANVDARGNLWSAHWGAGEVVCYSPQGSIVGRVSVPTCQPSCIAFGGDQLQYLFVTSARQGLSDERLAAQMSAGNVFVFELSGDLAVRGLPEATATL